MNYSENMVGTPGNRSTLPAPIEPIVVAIALSLYAYNVDPGTRARKIIEYFIERGQGCMTAEELIDYFQSRHGAYLATELPFMTAEVYVQQAMAQYGQEAAQRVWVESQI